MATTAAVAFLVLQAVYLLSMLTVVYLLSRPVNWVEDGDGVEVEWADAPKIILLYPVLRELEETMRTTFLGLGRMEYPKDRYQVIAIPNEDDESTIRSLERLSEEFPFVEILPVPPTSDPRWRVVFDAWDDNEACYWWHEGPHAHDGALPPKKTRQLVYAFYTLCAQKGVGWLLDYIDADSVPPPGHFRSAAIGMRDYDVLQATNTAGNLLDSWSATMHTFDHLAWDGGIYPHLTANGRQPFWVLGKGLFFKAADLFEHGGFNPWLTIEDPEVGMRLWVNGKRLGVIRDPLIEEVPVTFGRGITQRKRWVAGFLQSLVAPLKEMGYTRRQRLKARLNVVPCLSLAVSPIGLAVNLWAVTTWIRGSDALPRWSIALSALTLLLHAGLLVYVYSRAWDALRQVLSTRRRRLYYLFRVAPPFLYLYWVLWSVPIAIGLKMFLFDGGLVWERTEKIDANHSLVRATTPSVIDLTEPNIPVGASLGRDQGDVIDLREAEQETAVMSDPAGSAAALGDRQGA